MIIRFLLLLALAAVAVRGFAPVVSRAPAISGLAMTKLTYNGKSKDFKPGTPLSRAVAQLGVKVKYSCKKGDCATCQVSLAGRMTRCCIGKVPEAPKLRSLQEKGLEIRG